MKRICSKCEKQIEIIDSHIIGVDYVPSSSSFPLDSSSFVLACDDCYNEPDITVSAKSAKYEGEDGMQLVDEYNSTYDKIKELEVTLDLLKQKIIYLSNEKHSTLIAGSKKTAYIKDTNKIIYPDDKTEIITLMEKKGIYKDLSMINYMKIKSIITKGELDKDIVNLLKIEKEKSLRLINKK